jgi:nucleoporin SEH1
MKDFYGKRIATCSSDRKINIFEHDDEIQSWLPSASWKAHDAAIIQVLP